MAEETRMEEGASVVRVLAYAHARSLTLRQADYLRSSSKATKSDEMARATSQEPRHTW